VVWWNQWAFESGRELDDGTDRRGHYGLIQDSKMMNGGIERRNTG
jgi:hypothetical protein